MITQTLTNKGADVAESQWSRFIDLGRETAHSLRPDQHHPRWQTNPRSLVKKSLDKGQREAGPERKWLLENIRLIRTARKETLDLARTLRKHPVVQTPSGNTRPRPYALASSYLDAVENRFSEEALTAFLEGFQQVSTLEMG